MRAKNDRNTLLIGALAEQTSVNIETIRYYERVGLLSPPARTQGRHRIYGGAHVQRLSFIRRCRELGFSLDDVRTLLRIVDDSDLDCSATRDLTIRHLTDVRGKIESLNRLERALTAMSDACQPGSQSSCPIIDALSGAA